MRFPFVKRKDYEEVVDKLEYLLFEASGGILSQHTHPLETMYDAVRAYTQFCCDGAVEEKTRELKAEIERLTDLLDCSVTSERNAVDAIKEYEEKLHPYKLHYGNLRMEVAREFADRLKAKGVTAFRGGLVVTGNDIDNLIKEMEAENGSEALE